MTLAYWPYEEVSIRLLDRQRGKFSIQSPWLISELEIEPGSANFHAFDRLSSDGQAVLAQGPEVLLSLSEIFHSLRSLPIAYKLPRAGQSFGTDEPVFSQQDPVQSLAAEWTWDLEASLLLSSLPGTGRFDPLTLLTIARRFHALDCGDRKMDEVYAKVRSLPDRERRARASALIVRQNHYVTERCEEALSPALELAQSAREELTAFIQAEKGHDRLLAGGLSALGVAAAAVEVTPAAIELMTALKAAAESSFLGFCLCLDFFEKPQFREEDALAEVLSSLGESQAARALQIHKDINDGGPHEAIASELLSHMKPVESEYAIQAMRHAERVSRAIARVPHELDGMI